MATASRTTVSRVSAVIVPVRDQDAALAFYTEKLGLEKRADVPMTEDGGRWIEVAPQGAETPIALCPPGPSTEAGDKETGIGLYTDDAEAYRAQLETAGVDVDAEVSRMGGPVPPIFWLRDPEGNVLMVVEES
jgi:catechol 2,3-dioxygenase-like lactoylglutathione lyase family enzyme